MSRATFSLRARYAPIVEEQKARLQFASNAETIERALDLLVAHNPTVQPDATSVQPSTAIPEQPLDNATEPQPAREEVQRYYVIP